MDYLSRLIAGSGAQRQKSNTPTERLTVCKRICNNLQHVWRNSKPLYSDDDAATHVANLLSRLNTLLHNESRNAAPHSCLSYVASSQIYIIVVKLALTAEATNITRSATQLLHILINGEADGVLDSKIFARSLVDLVKRVAKSNKDSIEDLQNEADLVELLFEIATKIRLDPSIIPAWYYPEREQNKGSDGSKDSRQHQFPLFYLLVEYVHQDPPTGDFARTALLYLTEVASQSKQLEKWMIESDLALQMASGLGAMYSRLNGQIPPFNEDEKVATIIQLSDPIERYATADTTPEDFQQNVKAFLSYLAFWQDTLNHCTSPEVTDTLLDHFQIVFVQQLLYPSLLESSDVGDSSTSAVLSHLCRILEALTQKALIRRMLHYLFGDGNTIPEQGHRNRRQRMSISRRKSMDQLKTLSDQLNAPSPNLFSLTDLLTLSLRSQRSQTVATSLKLLSIVLQRHHEHVQTVLFKLMGGVEDRSMESFNKTLTILFDLTGGVGPGDTLDCSYQCALEDAQVFLRAHSCLACEKVPDVPFREGTRLTVAPDCKLHIILVEIMHNFFSNDTVTNIALTEAIVSLASCEHISLQGWLLPQAESVNSATFVEVITHLVEQVKQWRALYSDWDQLVISRRAKLDHGDEHEAFNHPTGVKSIKITKSPDKAQQAGSTPGSSPRASTPRGRRQIVPAFASLDSNLSGSPQSKSDMLASRFGSSPLRQTAMHDITDSISTYSVSVVSNDMTMNHFTTLVSLPQSEAQLPYGPPQSALAQGMQMSYSNGNSSDASNSISDQTIPSLPEEPSRRTSVTLGHIITNAIVLQEFVLEIAAILQIRATLFSEIDVA